MSPSGVGFAFALLVLSREGYRLWRPWHRQRQEAKAECARIGHEWGEPFGSDLGRHRNCRRCKTQQHWSSVKDDWL